MIRNLKFGKKFIAGLLAVSIIGTISSLHLYKKSEVNRVKGYLEDFLTDDNYVDMSKINGDYKISGFDGDILFEAIKEVNPEYIRFNDSYIYDGAHVTGFNQKTATNYNVILGVDDTNNFVYDGYEPIRIPTEKGVDYSYPDNYILEDIHVLAEPIRYNELDDKVIEVVENDYDNSYSLVMCKKK